MQTRRSSRGCIHVRSTAVVVMIMLLAASFPVYVESRRNHQKRHGQHSMIKSAATIDLSADRQRTAVISEFKSWVDRVGAKVERRREAAARSAHELRRSSDSRIVAGNNTVEPDLSQDFPGMKKYLDWQTVVSSSTYIVVDQNGGGDFRSINEAVNSIPRNKYRKYRITIQVNPGVYREKVSIGKTRPFITLQGNGQPTIEWNDTNFLSGNHTFDSATFGVSGNFFMARNCTFKNSAPAPPPGAVGMQAVALRITSDMAAFYNCAILGYQDTLYDHNGRHYFKDCFIQGSIDFIFGDGLSIYKDCELNVVRLPATAGALTAQKRQNSTDDSGFSFIDCSVTGAGQVYLGRAWGPFSRVVYSYTYMSDVIYAPGWFDWAIPARQQSVYYGQYRCSGPGAVQEGRVAWSHELTPAEAAPFLSLDFVDGTSWIPAFLL